MRAEAPRRCARAAAPRGRSRGSRSRGRRRGRSRTLDRGAAGRRARADRARTARRRRRRRRRCHDRATRRRRAPMSRRRRRMRAQAAASAELAGVLGWDPDQRLRSAGAPATGEPAELAALRARLARHPERVAAVRADRGGRCDGRAGASLAAAGRSSRSRARSRSTIRRNQDKTDALIGVDARAAGVRADRRPGACGARDRGGAARAAGRRPRPSSAPGSSRRIERWQRRERDTLARARARRRAGAGARGGAVGAGVPRRRARPRARAAGRARSRGGARGGQRCARRCRGGVGGSPARSGHRCRLVRECHVAQSCGGLRARGATLDRARVAAACRRGGGRRDDDKPAPAAVTCKPVAGGDDRRHDRGHRRDRAAAEARRDRELADRRARRSGRRRGGRSRRGRCAARGDRGSGAAGRQHRGEGGRRGRRRRRRRRPSSSSRASERLVDSGIGARKDLDDARAKAAAAAAELDAANARAGLATSQLARRELRAPRAGVVLHLWKRVGESVDGTDGDAGRRGRRPLDARAPRAGADRRARAGSPTGCRRRCACSALDAPRARRPSCGSRRRSIRRRCSAACGSRSTRSRRHRGRQGRQRGDRAHRDRARGRAWSCRRPRCGARWSAPTRSSCATATSRASATVARRRARRPRRRDRRRPRRPGEQVVVDHVLGLEDGQALGCQPRSRAARASRDARSLAARATPRSSGSPRSRSRRSARGRSSRCRAASTPRWCSRASSSSRTPASSSPDLVEAQMTRPLEQALAVVPGVRHVRARTIRGAVELSLQLTDQRRSAARRSTRARPRSITSSCRRARRRSSQRVLPTSVPVITFNLEHGAGRDARSAAAARRRRAHRAAGDRPRPRASARSSCSAGACAQVEIADPARPSSRALHLTPTQLAHQDRAVGPAWSPPAACSTSTRRCRSCSTRRPTDLDQLRALPIANGPDGPIPLSAVADVVEGAEDPDVIVRGPRGEAVAISVARLPGREHAGRRRRRARGGRAACSARTRCRPMSSSTPVYDQAELVDESMASVRDAILIGIALSLIVIALALRDLRAGLIAALPVPITLLGTFAVMRWLGITLNLMSLGGLAIAIGLVVDDAIVVTEGIVAPARGGPRDRRGDRARHRATCSRPSSARRSPPSSCSRRSRCSPA